MGLPVPPELDVPAPGFTESGGRKGALALTSVPSSTPKWASIIEPNLEELRVRLRSRLVRELNRQGYRLRTNGFSRNGEPEKEFIRSVHARQRRQRLIEELPFLRRRGVDLLGEFAEGTEVDPAKFYPELVLVESQRDADLFRFASLLWSVPTSRGFGRRMRYLVRDRQNDKLVGLIALGDPVFNLSARDDWIGWSAAEREERLVHVMDAYVLGAVPPYNHLLCGKLIAALATSTEIRRAFRKKYRNTKGIISQKGKDPQLALLTTTSALGRSSLYNRLELPCGVRFHKVGATKGYGHFHLPEGLFDEIRQFMAHLDHPYAEGHRFGDGPNWRIRLLRAAFQELGIKQQTMRHGIEREVYLCPLAENTVSFLRARSRQLRPITWPVDAITKYCKMRWILPRAERDSSYRSVTRTYIAAQLAHAYLPAARIFGLDKADIT